MIFQGGPDPLSPLWIRTWLVSKRVYACLTSSQFNNIIPSMIVYSQDEVKNSARPDQTALNQSKDVNHFSIYSSALYVCLFFFFVFVFLFFFCFGFVCLFVFSLFFAKNSHFKFARTHTTCIA